MAKYTIIADIGKGMRAMLRDKLVPDPVDKSESIGICDPKDRGGYVVGIHPYDIREDTSGANKKKTTLPDGSQKDAPAMMELYYVISVNSKAEIESKALDEAKIIGKIIQIFKDNPTIPKRYMPSNLGMPVEPVPVNMLPLNMEEKVKVWTMFGESYKLSVFYVVGPVAIDSEKVSKPKKRVERIYLDPHQYVHKKVLEFATFIKEEDIDDEYTQRPDEDEDEDEDSGSDEYGEEEYGDEDAGNEMEENGEEYEDEMEENGQEEYGDENNGDENEENGLGDYEGENTEDEDAESNVGEVSDGDSVESQEADETPLEIDSGSEENEDDTAD